MMQNSSLSTVYLLKIMLSDVLNLKLWVEIDIIKGKKKRKEAGDI